MKAAQPSVSVRQIELELEKAEHGMGLPYDAGRRRAVAQHASRGAQAETVSRAGGKTTTG